MAAMAPALTEAATQKIKLESTANPAASTNIQRNQAGQTDISTDTLSTIVNTFKSTPISHKANGNGGTKQTTSLLAKLKVSIKDPRLFQSGFQRDFVKSLKDIHFRKAPQIMNQPSPKQDNEEERSQTGSRPLHRPMTGGNNTGVINPGQSRVPAVSGQSVTQPRTGTTTSMCKKQEEGTTKLAVGSSPASSPGQIAPGKNSLLSSSLPSTSRTLSSVTSSPDSHHEDKADEGVQKARVEASKKQAQLERRMEFLQRRLRRIQSRQVDKHARQQLVGFVDYQHQNLETVVRSAESAAASDDNGGDLSKELLSDDCKNLSTAALVSLVQRMQKSIDTAVLFEQERIVVVAVQQFDGLRDRLR